MREKPIYKQLTYWAQNYGNSSVPDQRAVETFMDCETREGVSGLRNELMGVAGGNFDETVFDKILGANRKFRHGSYIEWARMMLLWMASYKA